MLSLRWRIGALAVFLLTGTAAAQIGPGPFVYFPTDNTRDGRFLGFSCSGTGSFEQGITIGLAVPADSPSFTVSLFDGDTGKPDTAGKPHWDLGTRQVVMSLFADPRRQQSVSPADLIGSWKGNDPNPLSGPSWSASAASMPDNDWWGVTITPNSQAQAPSGNYFYTLVIQLDGACNTGETLESNLKIAASNPMAFLVPRFGLVAAMRQVFNDGPILYPNGFPPAGNNYLNAATTYDGTFEFFFSLPPGETDLQLFDGDFDFGTAGLTGAPSAKVLFPCVDTDDPDTSAAYDGFPFSTAGISSEGVKWPGFPPDDNAFDAFRRGELDSPERIGCVRYEVTDPLGTVYRNDDPSGNQEWERFRIASPLAFDPNDSDYVTSTDTLPAGIWKVRVVGLDLSNLNFFSANACSARTENGRNVPLCPSVNPYLVGTTVWLDLNGNGTLDAGEEGIPGVVVKLYTPDVQAALQSSATGVADGPNWAACKLNNTGNDLLGLYCFGLDEPGAYTVQVDPANFLPGGALYGLAPTTGNQITATLTDDNVLTYNFGYRAATPPPGTGTIGYWKNHPEAWPVERILVGGVTYTKSEAIALMGASGKGDKSYDLFKQLVATKLNLIIGNSAACISATVASADSWQATYPPGSGVKGSGAVWQTGGPLHTKLDDYNNGELCAPHRD